MLSFYQKNESMCSNCGGTGHGYRVCIEPVSSYGVLVFRWISRSGAWPQVNEFCKDPINPTGITSLVPQVLMIQRKDSLGFMDIMRGKYKVNEPDYIKKQLKGMTESERQKLKSMEFEEIWHELWGSDTESTQRYVHDRVNSRLKLAELRAGVKLSNGEEYSLDDLLRQEPALYTTPEWGFPKGRRDPYESDIHCAYRELEEETSITEQELLKVTNIQPFIEQFYGSNNIHYRHTYYIAQYVGDRDISYNKLNPEMTREIGNLAWKNLDEAILLLRPENLEKRSMLLQLANVLRNYSPVLRCELVAKSLRVGLDQGLAPTSVNENTTEEQYVFTGQSNGAGNPGGPNGPISGKMEKTRRLFGARQITRRVSYIYRSNQGSNTEGTRSNVIQGATGNTISRH
jgi:8-oxo-dGTP pyrophosphatase MutT (NUDIX family)